MYARRCVQTRTVTVSDDTGGGSHDRARMTFLKRPLAHTCVYVRVPTWLLSLPLFGVETITLQGYGTRYGAGATRRCNVYVRVSRGSTDGERDHAGARTREGEGEKSG